MSTSEPVTVQEFSTPQYALAAEHPASCSHNLPRWSGGRLLRSQVLLAPIQLPFTSMSRVQQITCCARTDGVKLVAHPSSAATMMARYVRLGVTEVSPNEARSYLNAGPSSILFTSLAAP